MKKPKVVIDTNVLVTALRSSRGASFALIAQIENGIFDVAVSVSLVAEYEAAAKRLVKSHGVSGSAIDDIIDFICLSAERRKIYYLWRPYLKDPSDDLVLEIAVASQCEYIVTYNTKDFSGIEIFGIKTITPYQLLKKLEVLK